MQRKSEKKNVAFTFAQGIKNPEDLKNNEEKEKKEEKIVNKEEEKK